jgi:hypothetical protein
MKLKCITGPCDSFYMYVDSRYRQGDIINIPAPKKELVYNPKIDINSQITQDYYQYKIEEFHGPHGQNLKFLIPAYEDVWNVFYYVFT